LNLCELWSRSYTMHLQLRIFRLQYSSERICAAIADISRMLRAIYCNLGAKYSAHPAVYAMWTVVPRYTMQLQFRICRLQYSTQCICAAIGDISTIQCALHCKVGAKYSAHPPIYAMWTVVPYKYKVFAAPHIQTSIFNWTYLRCYWRYLDYPMRVILQTLSPTQRTSFSLRNVYCGTGHIQSIYRSAYLGFNIQL
jgi:hypothetical protein